jgi:tetratricopeptide (TPR) repeat protein
VQADFATLECLRAESRLLHEQGKVLEAIALIERGMTRLGNTLRGTWYYAAVRDQLAGLHRAAGDNVAALEISEDQLDMLYEMGRQGSSVELLMLSGYGRDLCRVGEYVACADVQHKVLAALDLSDTSGFAIPGGRTRAGLAELALGDAQQALDLAERDLQISSSSGNLAVIAQAHWLAASSLLALGRIDAAEKRLGAAEKIWGNSPGMFGAYLNEAALLRADIALARGDIAVAQRGVDALLSEADYPSKLNAPRLDAYLQLAARVALRDGRAEAAAAFALDAVQVTRRSARTAVSSGDVGLSLLLHAQALSALGRKADAAAAAESALASLAVGFGESHTATKQARTLLREASERTI